MSLQQILSPYAAPLLTPVLLPIGGVRHKILTRSMRFLYTPPTGEPRQRRGEGEDVKERGVEKQGEQKDQEMLLHSQRFFRQGSGGNDAAALT